ncbi:hypothetical protein [Metabacillus fastidiosus]|uniref:hypothetical protein n=1 Tax=Metabacillus fastidiosus TaxID=1458 RepID=UPI003D29B710
MDTGAIGWCFFWIIGLLAIVIPSQFRMGLADSINFLFSFELLELKEVEVKEGIAEALYEAEVLRVESFNKLLQFVNIGKIVFWIATFIMLFVFLFKRPETEENEYEIA